MRSSYACPKAPLTDHRASNLTSHQPTRRGRLRAVSRRVVLLVYLALFVGELSWSGVTPLIPAYIDRFGLTDFEGGLLLSVASAGILAVSLPAGYVTRHISPRTLTIGAMGCIAVSDLAVAVSDSYLLVLAGRLAFGIGFGVLWVSMAAWLHDAAGAHSARVLALTTSIVGLSASLAPGITGTLAHRFTLSMPFVGLAAASAVLFGLLALDRSGTGLRKDPAPPTRDLARAVRADPDLLTMLLLTTAAAVVWMTADLLVPLRLDDGGFDVAAIGLVFSVSSVVFVASSVVTARGADRWARPRIAAVASGAIAACTAIPAVLAGVPAALVFLAGASVATGVTIALTYPFGLLAVERGRVTVAVMSALVNIVWALGGLAGPTLGGAFTDWAGDQIAFAALTVIAVVVAVLVTRQHSRPAAVEPTK